MDARQSPDAEPRPAHRERDRAVVPRRRRRDELRLRQDKLAPRLGAAYDVRGDGKFKVYGSWGRYYDWTKYELPRGSFGGDTWQIYYRALDTLDLGSLNLSNMPGADLWVRAGRLPRSPRAELRLDRPGHQADVPGQHQHRHRVPARRRTWCSAPTTSTTTCGGRSRTSARSTRRATRPTSSATPVKAWRDSSSPSGATPLGPAGAEAEAPVRRARAHAQQALLEQLLLERQLRAEPALRQLLGHRGSATKSRTPTTGARRRRRSSRRGSIARPGGNANRAWDIDEIFWDSHGNLDVLGRLPTDRPHVVKLYGSLPCSPFGTQFGVVLLRRQRHAADDLRQHGQPDARCSSNGRGDMGRTDVLTRTDLLVSHELKLGGGNKRLRLELNVLNVFNQKTSRHQFNFLNRGAGAPRASSAIDLSGVDLRNGYDYNALIRGVAGRRQRLRSALRHGRPVRARHAGLLHGSLPLLSRSAAAPRAPPAVSDCSFAAHEGRAPTGVRPVLCTGPGAPPDRLSGVMNPKTPDGVPEKEWAKVTKLALAAAAASGKADEAAAADVTQKLLTLLEGLEQKFGPLPGILAARADFLDDPDEAVQAARARLQDRRPARRRREPADHRRRARRLLHPRARRPQAGRPLAGRDGRRAQAGRRRERRRELRRAEGRSRGAAARAAAGGE